MAEPETRTPERKIEQAPRQFSANLPLEVVFLGFIAVVTLGAFFQALTYKIVSARTPFVILAPLILLVALHGVRLYRARHQTDITERLLAAVRGHMIDLNKVLVLSAWFFGVLVLIVVFGHYIGITLFALLLMWRAGQERIGLSVVITIGMVLFIWLVFEQAFNIELYRGLLLRYFQGYKDF